MERKEKKLQTALRIFAKTRGAGIIGMRHRVFAPIIINARNVKYIVSILRRRARARMHGAKITRIDDYEE